MINTLLVEDNSIFRSRFGAFLRNQWPSIRIDEAWSEDQVFYLVDNNLHDVIFMDISLPGTNGLGLTRKIKSGYPHIKIIILTGHDEIEYFDAAKDAGADHFFTKDNFHKANIVDIMKTVVAEKNLTTTNRTLQ